MGMRYLERDQIDKVGWDNCILNSSGGRIYATVQYLDVMADKCWGGVIEGGYDAVLPLPHKEKYGIKYISLPAFTQQMGIISKKKIDDVLIEESFINAIPKKYKYICLNMNSDNLLQKNIIRRKNHILDISQEYDEIKKGYSRLANRNIKKAKLNGIIITQDISCNDVIRLQRLRFRGKDTWGKESDYQKFLSLMHQLQKEKRGFVFGALNQRGELIASSFYMLYKNRLTFIINGNLPESLGTGATHLLKDFVIKKFSSQNLLMDFEGSDNVNFARFYKQFGAVEECYGKLIINRLPWYLKTFKK